MKTSTDSSRLELFYTAPLEATGNKPLYRMVEDHIRTLISTGRLIPGDLIPSESQLAKVLNVSAGTIKKAITNLVWEQLLFRHQGKGTYVSRVDFENNLFRFFLMAMPKVDLYVFTRKQPRVVYSLGLQISVGDWT